jgi:hypothetical protein
MRPLILLLALAPACYNDKAIETGDTAVVDTDTGLPVDTDTDPVDTDTDPVDTDTDPETDTVVTGDCPHIEVNPSFLEWTDVPLGSVTEKTVTVTNGCDDGDILNVLVTTRPGRGPFARTSSAEMNIAPGASDNVTVEYTADNVDPDRMDLILASNDPNAPELTIHMDAYPVTDGDGDGYDALDAFEGTDCDDTDATIHPDATEVQNAKDDDCDGLADELFLHAGDVYVTEFLADPSAVPDSSGEYIELYNGTANALDLVGWTISSDDGSSFTILGSLLVDAGGYVVLGVDLDFAANGGVTVDYAYDGTTFSLGDTEDSLHLDAGTLGIFDLAYTGDWGVTTGAALGLDLSAYSPANAATSTHWCDATTQLAGGDYGTPGADNDGCP